MAKDKILTIITILKKRFNAFNSFNFNGNELYYFFHMYNNWRTTDRAIEVPIIHYYLTKYKPSRCLEIGNVTNHYYTYFQKLMFHKIVVDKYEKAIDVINKDIGDYYSKEKFDFIYSISTFEHMDSNRDREKGYIKKERNKDTNICKNIQHVINDLLNKKGVFILNAPIGYAIEWNHVVLDDKIMNPEFLNVKSINIYFFERVDPIVWKQVFLSDKKIDELREYIITPYGAKDSQIIAFVEIIK